MVLQNPLSLDGGSVNGIVVRGRLRRSAKIVISMNRNQYSKIVFVLTLPVFIYGCSVSNASQTSSEQAKKDETVKSGVNYFTLVDVGDLKKYKPRKDIKKLHTLNEFITEARHALKHNAYRDASEFAGEAVRLDPDCAEAHYIYGKGLAASADGDDDEALVHLKKALSLGLENGDLYEYMAKIYDSRKQYKKAIEALTNAIRVDKSDREYFKYRGALHELLGNYDEAESDYTVNVNRSLGASSAFLDRGKFYENNEKYEKALKDFNTALKMQTRDTDELTARARLFLKIGRKEDAVKDLNEIIEHNPQDDDSIRTRGDIYFSQKKYKDAIDDYSMVISNSPDIARTAYESRARVFEVIGQDVQARKDREKARKIKEKPAEKPLFRLKH